MLSHYYAKETPWIQTISGIKFHGLNPDPAEILVSDIIHALSNLCRYAGHCKSFYSVAEHSYLMAQYAIKENYSAEEILWCMLHDVSEIYIQDIPSPFKYQFPEYLQAEKSIMEMVAIKFQLPFPIPKVIEVLDARILLTERQTLFYNPLEWGNDIIPLPVDVKCLLPNQIRALYSVLLKQLLKEHGDFIDAD